MKWLRIILAVLGQLVVVGIVLAIVGAGEARFEKLVLSGLVLIYAAMTHNFAHLWRLLAEVDRLSLGRFLQLKAVAGEATSSDERSSAHDLDEELYGANQLMLVRAIGTWICTIIAIVGLLGAL